MGAASDSGSTDTKAGSATIEDIATEGTDHELPVTTQPEAIEKSGGNHDSGATVSRSLAVTADTDHEPTRADPVDTQTFSLAASTLDQALPAATSQASVDWGLPLPQYPEVAGVTKTEVAAVVFVALAGATVTSLAVNPLIAIPLALMTLTAFGRLVELGANTAPTATYQQTSQVLGVVTGDVDGFDPDGDPLAYGVSQQGQYGLAVIDPISGGYVYTAYNLGLSPIQDTFYVAVDDSAGIREHPFGAHTVTIPISVSIPGITVNQLPVFDQPASITHVNGQTGVVTGVFKAHDPEGTALTYTGLALIGSVHVADSPNEDGTYTFTYTPYDAHAASLLGTTVGLTDVVTITATDTGGLFAISTVPVTLATTVNVAPTGTYQNTNVNTTLGTVTGKIIVTDADDAIHAFTPALPFTTDKGGLVAVSALTGDYVYTASLSARQAASAANAGAEDKFDVFTVTVDDLHGGTVEIEVNVPIPTINLAPAGGVPSNLLGDADGVVRGHIVGVINLDNDPLTYSLLGGGSTAYTSGGGIVHVDSAGNYTYIPKVNTVTALGITSNLPYIDSFDVVVDDGRGGTASVTVGVVTSLIVSTSTSSPASGTVNGTVNFDKPENAALFSFGMGSAPAKGTVAVNPDGTFHYTATTAGPGETDTFGIAATAYGLTLQIASVTVTPVPPNHGPTADLIGVGLGDSAGIAKGNVHASDPDGDPLTYSVTGYGGAPGKVMSNGAIVQVDSQGNWAYVPPASGGLLGVINDTFTVYISDGRGGTTSTTVNVTTKVLDIGYTNTVGATSVTGALNIPSGDVGLMTFSVGGTAPAGLTFNSGGSYSYTGASPATFSVIGTNAYGQSMTVTNVTVTPNRPPTISSTGLKTSTITGGQKERQWTGVTVNDPDGNTVTLTLVSVTRGTVTISGPDILGTYTILYRSDGGNFFSNGPSASFVVKVTDSLGASNTYTYSYP